MEKNPSIIPKNPDGTLDRELVKAGFMASPYLDWTRFAEEQGWCPHFTRRQFQVATWQKEKRDLMAEKQGDILQGLMHERKFKWTRDILDTLDRYPKLIDMGSNLAEAKMHQMAETYKDYLAWRKEGKHIKVLKNGVEKRLTHPWEKISPMDINFMLKGLKEVTEAKLKALMIDKWGMAKLDIPKEELGAEDDNASDTSHRITVEGKGEITFAQMQDWFDQFADKPDILEATATPKPVEPAAPAKSHNGTQILDDNGRPIGGE